MATGTTGTEPFSDIEIKVLIWAILFSIPSHLIIIVIIIIINGDI